MALIYKLDDFLEDLKFVSEKINYGDVWLDTHSQIPNSINPLKFGNSLKRDEIEQSDKSIQEFVSDNSEEQKSQISDSKNLIRNERVKPKSYQKEFSNNEADILVENNHEDEKKIIQNPILFQNEKSHFFEVEKASKSKPNSQTNDLVTVSDLINGKKMDLKNQILFPKQVNFELSCDNLPIIKEPINIQIIDSSSLSRIFGTNDVRVFIPNSTTPINVPVIQTSTIHQLIIQTIKSYNKLNLENKMNESPDAYLIRIAQEDGQVDEMFPGTIFFEIKFLLTINAVLGKLGTVDQWSNVPFILIKNPNFKKNSQSQKQKKSTSTAQIQTKKLTAKITLPSGAYHTLLVEPSMKIKKLLEQICEKRQLIPSNFSLQAPNLGTYLSQNIRLSELDDLNLTLVQKTNENPVVQSENITWNEVALSQYKIYPNVIYHYKNNKKFISKQCNASISIDDSKVTLNVSKSKKNLKTITFQLNDVKNFQSFEDKPLFLNIETAKEKFTIETSSLNITKEIIAKLTYLIKKSM